MSRILVVTHEPVAPRLAGPAMRSLGMAQALARAGHHVELAAPAIDPAAAGLIGLPHHVFAHPTLAALAARFDVVTLTGLTYNFAPGLRQAGPAIVIDTFIPFLLEELQAKASWNPERQQDHHASLLGAMNQQLAEGDYFLVASEKQRDFFLGALAANGRLVPTVYRDDPALRNLVDVVPFGIPPEPPRSRPGVLKGQGAFFSPETRVLFWGGGLYDWFDPGLAIHALRRIVDAGEDVGLAFAGVRHPNPDVGEMAAVGQARSLVAELGLQDRVLFNDWIPFEDRGAWLLEADLGVSFHRDHLETRFSFRTRLIDAIWAGLPMVLSEGDSLGQDLASAGVARQVAEDDVDGATVAIREMLVVPRTEWPGRFRDLQERYAWEWVIGPLDAFCRNPRRTAPARTGRAAAGAGSASARAWQLARAGRLGDLGREGRAWAAWQWRQRRG